MLYKTVIFPYFILIFHLQCANLGKQHRNLRIWHVLFWFFIISRFQNLRICMQQNWYFGGNWNFYSFVCIMSLPLFIWLLPMVLIIHLYDKAWFVCTKKHFMDKLMLAFCHFFRFCVIKIFPGTEWIPDVRIIMK